jgi:hypothetical protein
VNETRELIVYGVDEPSEALAALMQRSPSDLRVSWRSAPYTLEELTTEIRRLMSARAGRLSTAGPRHDGTGLVATTTDPDLLEAIDPRAALGSRYPVTLTYGQPARLL